MSATDTVETISRLIIELKPEAAEKVSGGARLQSEVGLTSVEIIDLVLAAEDEFEVEIPDDDTGELMDATVEELARRVDALVTAG